MFTPPSSPQPPRNQGDPTLVFTVDLGDDDLTCEEPEPPFVYPDDRKRAMGRRTTWAVILLPLVLVLITITTHFFTHPVILDVLSNVPIPDWRTWKSTAVDWRMHKRHADSGLWGGGPETSIIFPSQPGGGGTGTASAGPGQSRAPTQSGGGGTTSIVPFPTQSGTGTTPTATRPTTLSSQTYTQQLPTVPATPANVPTPFPQPFDTSLQQNFSSVSCYNFFLNMTNSIPFRSCRPFSLLLQSSEAFIQAQTNITLLNNVIWGMCNTQLGEPQCVRNIAWFTSSLQASCVSDLGDRNSLAESTLTALQAYTLMQQAGCLIDQTTNTYCYVEAAYNTNPSDLYFYQLPLGVSLPNTTTSTCSGCTKSIMALYSAALGNSSERDSLQALKSTYRSAARLADAECGQGYAVQTTSSSIIVTVPRLYPTLWAGAIVTLLCWSLWAS